MPKNEGLQNLSLEALVDVLVQKIESQESAVDVAAELNGRMIKVSKTIDIRDVDSVLNSKDNSSTQEVSDFSLQLKNALIRAKDDPLFCSKLKVLFEFANIELIESCRVMQNKSLYKFYDSFVSISNIHIASQDIWFPDLSFLTKNDKQKPFGKTGKERALVPLGWMHAMQASYWGADNKKLEYLSPQTKKLYKLRCAEDKILYRNVDDENGQHTPIKRGEYLFALTKGLSIIAATRSEIDNAHHSSFLAGQPVVVAGHMQVNEQGSIYGLDNISGHYAPRDEVFFCAAIRLFERGIIGLDCELNSYGNLLPKKIALRDLLIYSIDNISSQELKSELIRWRDQNASLYDSISKSGKTSNLSP